ncbi:S8 family peptidase [Paramicrobacterium agarici]|uniref:Subtilase family protein n=1 Tax=Paramicrobacterium agarici TaxID=630514 RepID=A0A2A9DYL8_9MICO|nr:S8 family serine peptidase [Microbacterium agarici]PFG31778.1 subtilase family protein [Microbacterium agarici]TQO21675.1 subtilase family protein [Microbacterium agarici]
MTQRPRVRDRVRAKRLLQRAVAIVATAGAMTVLSATPAAAFAGDRTSQYWLDSGYGIQEAWKTTKGKGAVIAVMDTGIGKGPADFAGVTGGIDVSGVGSPDGRTPLGSEEERNHGSWVASLAAGRGDGSENEPLGVAPEATLLSISIGFPSSGATVPFIDQVSEGIHWAVDNGADVINMSFSTNTKEWDPSWDEAFKYAHDNDVIIVAAAGNRGSGTEMVGAPATIPGVLTVAGVDKSTKVSEGASTEGITIGVSAPSEELTGVSADGTRVQWAGTSGAAPIVAGMVALLRSAYPDMDANNIINRLIKTAHPTEYQGDEVPSSDYGYGLANVGDAINKDVETVDANPMGSLEKWITVNRRAEAENVEPPVDTTKVKALPPIEKSNPSVNPFLPTADTIRYVSVPAALLLGAGTLITLGAIGATRHAKRVARKK